MPRVSVKLPHQSYDVLLEPNLLARSGSIVRDLAPHARAAILCDQAVEQLYAAPLEKSLTSAGFTVNRCAFPSGEENKRAQNVLQLYERLVQAGVERKSPILAVGGGVAGDLAGFVAATYLRGVPLIQVPTTLLAMVDASVGGKVGYNLPQGKNLVGAFYQPQGVLIDPLVLRSLPEREFRSGLAECVKHALLADRELFDWTSQNLSAILAQEPAVLAELIQRNVQIKADIVMADEFETGIRAHLNLGHTFGHAIEATAGYGTFLHGEAVSLGLCAAASFAVARGICESQVLTATEALLAKIGLPVRAELAPTDQLIQAMMTDKKVKDGKIRLILPTAIGAVQIINDAAASEISLAWDAIRV